MGAECRDRGGGVLWELGDVHPRAGSWEWYSGMTSKGKGSGPRRLRKVREGYKYSVLWLQVPLA